MSIVVDNLSKVYGHQKALDQISFEVPKGRITGFLGPNGAGKSTTMKIATGFINASSGSIHLNGEKASADSIAVKRSTGYLPEHNPLYLDMYVKEYLKFIASAYKVKSAKKRIEEMIELCGLEREQRKKIGQLSKGYRQRVGLAQALVHDPDILILDEPTSGLDPNQLVEIRKVIKSVSTNKTVMLSSHIMQEVEALCDQVVIINKGKIVADDEVNHLKRQSQKITYQIEFEEPVAVSLFEDFEVLDNGAQLTISSDEDPRKQLMKIITSNDLPLINIQKQEISLENVFQSLTQDQ